MGAILNNPDINNLIFLHIPKCAGTTFLLILNHQYHKLKSFDIKPITPDKINLDLLPKMTYEERREINILKGHLVYGIHEYLIGKSAYVTFLRHPVERIVSLYHFMKNNPDNRMYPAIKKYNLNIEDFVLKVNDHDISNGMINRIGGIPFEKEDIQFEKALLNIEKHFPIVGLVEKYDESLLVMKDYYHWNWPYYAIVNKNKKKPKRAASKKLEQLIIEHNQWDLKLYQAMEKRLDEQISKSSNDIDKQLKKFNSINQLLVHPHMFKVYSKIRSLI